MPDDIDPQRSQPPLSADTAGPLEVHKLKWDPADEVQKSLGVLFQNVERHASSSIDWYRKKKTRKARLSSTLRLFAIVWTTLGGLTPILGSIGVRQITIPGASVPVELGNLGYLFLGFAAACIGLDKYFGFSSGWMRYITTMMTLERRLSEFRYDWAMMLAKLGKNIPTTDQIQLMIQRLKDFLTSVDTLVEQETQAWISEFKTNLAEVEKDAKAHGETSRPGAIDISLTNGLRTENGFTVAIDGMEVRRVHGTKYQIVYVPPGAHNISVAGVIAGKQVEASEIVNVAPGAIASVTMAFPVAEPPEGGETHVEPQAAPA